VTIVTAEGKDKLCLRIIIDEYIHACGTLHVAWNHFTKFQRTFITHGERSFSCRRRIAYLAYFSVSIIYEKLAELYEFIYTTASTHFSFIDTLVRNKNSSVYV
jgi:hypothetical protein